MPRFKCEFDSRRPLHSPQDVSARIRVEPQAYDFGEFFPVFAVIVYIGVYVSLKRELEMSLNPSMFGRFFLKLWDIAGALFLIWLFVSILIVEGSVLIWRHV